MALFFELRWLSTIAGNRMLTTRDISFFNTLMISGRDSRACRLTLLFDSSSLSLKASNSWKKQTKKSDQSEVYSFQTTKNRAEIKLGLTGNMVLITMLGLCWQSATSWSIPLIRSLKSFEASRLVSCSLYSVLFPTPLTGTMRFPLADCVSWGILLPW